MATTPPVSRVWEPFDYPLSEVLWPASLVSVQHGPSVWYDRSRDKVFDSVVPAPANEHVANWRESDKYYRELKESQERRERKDVPLLALECVLLLLFRLLVIDFWIVWELLLLDVDGWQ